MAQHLIAAGHELAVWNRSEGKTEPLLREGAIAAGTPAEAELGADAVFTMLFDDHAYEEVLFGAHGLIDALTPGTLHIACSTISVAFSERLTLEHARRGIAFVAAPVFGRPNMAQAGKLWTAVAGSSEHVERARPLLETFSRGITVVGNHPPQAHAVKLGGNFLISAMIHSLSESFVYAEAQGIDPATFFETVNSALFQSPFYAAYAKVMLNPPRTPEANMLLGLKDVSLFLEAAAAHGTKLGFADMLYKIFQQARREGHGSEDWAAGQYGMVRTRSKS
jgi:3-hydroxyisobutyrate dehydrogenase-like beta-hydroxyacid dehydrogenase